MKIKKVSELIARKIKEQFGSQAEFARHQNMNKGLLNRFINSENEAQNGQKIKILKILGVPAREIREIVIEAEE
jgi:hypothetical protein